MRLFTLFLLLLIANSLMSQKARVNKRWLQQQDTARQAEVFQAGAPIGSALDYGGSLHVMPLSFINGFSRFRFGGQLKRKRWSYLLDLEVGSDFTQQWIGNREDSDFQFYGIRPELRYDLSKYSSDFYVGLELPVSVLNRKISGRFNSSSGDRRRVDEARQDRFRAAAIGKVGVQLLAGDHVIFDLYAGLGIAYRDVRYTERVGEVEPVDDFEEWGFFGDLSQEGTRWLPDLAAGFRVGWWF